MADNEHGGSTMDSQRGSNRPSMDPHRLRLRSWVAAVLVVLTSLSLALSTVSVWTHQTLFNTDEFMEVVDGALDDPALAAALSSEVSDQVLTALDLQTRVANALDRLDSALSGALTSLAPGDRVGEILGGTNRPTLSVLAPSVTQTLEARLTEEIDDLITSEQFGEVLSRIVSEAHRAAVALIRSESAQFEDVYVQDGEVRLNLLGVIGSVLQDVRSDIEPYLPDVNLPDALTGSIENATSQLADSLKAELPEDFGQVTIMSADTLDEIQSIGDTADRFVIVSILLTVVLLAATMVVSPHRRRTLIHLAIGTVVAIVLALIAVRSTRSAIIEQITDPNAEQTADTLLADLIDDLRSFAMIVVSVAVVVGLGAFIAGRPSLVARFTGRRGAADLSDTDRWVAGHPDLVRAGALIVALGAIAFFGVTWWSILIGALVLAGLLLYVGSVTIEATEDVEPPTEDALA